MKKAIVLVAVVLQICSVLMAQDTEESRMSLKGLTGVWVGLDPLDPAAEKDGLSADQIQTDVELRLRMAGIKVLTLEQVVATPGVPSLHVGVNALKRQETYSLSLSIRVAQMVKLSRDPQISVDATTWSAESVAIGASSKIDQVRNMIKDHVDKFINAWLSVNPKQ